MAYREVLQWLIKGMKHLKQEVRTASIHPGFYMLTVPLPGENPQVRFHREAGFGVTLRRQPEKKTPT